MDADMIEPEDLFGAIAKSGARALLIGRRAVAALGIPVLTADYDLWIHIDDIERLNAELDVLGLVPNRTPAQARARGRYVLENGERIDVLVARASTTIDGESVAFDDVWPRRKTLTLRPGIDVVLPSIEDLIRTKRWSARPHDLENIRRLRLLTGTSGGS